jgi:hypothetical protein
MLILFETVNLQALNKSIHAVGVAQSSLPWNGALDNSISITDKVVSPVAISSVIAVDLDTLKSFGTESEGRVLLRGGSSGGC